MSVIVISITFNRADHLTAYQKAIRERFETPHVSVKFVNHTRQSEASFIVTDYASDAKRGLSVNKPTVYVKARNLQPEVSKDKNLFVVNELSNSDESSNNAANWLYRKFMQSKSQSVPSQVSTQNIPKPSAVRTSSTAQNPRSRRRFGKTAEFRGTTNIPRPKGLLDTE